MSNIIYADFFVLILRISRAKSRSSSLKNSVFESKTRASRNTVYEICLQMLCHCSCRQISSNHTCLYLRDMGSSMFEVGWKLSDRFVSKCDRLLRRFASSTIDATRNSFHFEFLEKFSLYPCSSRTIQFVDSIRISLYRALFVFLFRDTTLPR